MPRVSSASYLARSSSPKHFTVVKAGWITSAEMSMTSHPGIGPAFAAAGEALVSPEVRAIQIPVARRFLGLVKSLRVWWRGPARHRPSAMAIPERASVVAGRSKLVADRLVPNDVLTVGNDISGIRQQIGTVQQDQAALRNLGRSPGRGQRDQLLPTRRLGT